MAIQEPSMQLLAEAAQNETPLSDAGILDEQGSSSLSDIDDNNESEVEEPSDEELSPRVSDEEAENDTEAETERLEESPDKLRKQKKVLLNADNEVTNTNATPTKSNTNSRKMSQEEEDGDQHDIQSEILDATSPISSPADSDDEGSPPGSPLSSASRKRKRGQDDSTSTKRAAMQVLKNAMGEDVSHSEKESAEFIITTANGTRKVKGADLLDESTVTSPAGNTPEETGDVQEQEDIEVEDAEESHDEADTEEVVPEVETNTKSEADLAMRKEAVEKVTNIEEQFAIFREKMYGEAMANINAELASLDSNNSTHPDHLAICAAITQQKEKRVALARTKFSLQVKNWQRRGKSEQAQYHSQYAQACRDIRDTSLSKANDEWYQIQKGRRAGEDSIAVVSLASYKRIDLVAQQTAYNTEVSILAGIAKYVGFPAAPEVTGASTTEIEEDLKALGTAIPVQQSHVSSSISQYMRQNLAAEKQFGKVTPWANAQHHAHGLHGTFPWSPARPNSPFTPATQSQHGDIPVTGGSASTIVGSHAPTPLSSEIAGSNSKSKNYNASLGETPSRNPYDNRAKSSNQGVYAAPRAKSHGIASHMDNPVEFSSPQNLTSGLKTGMA